MDHLGILDSGKMWKGCIPSYQNCIFTSMITSESNLEASVQLSLEVVCFVLSMALFDARVVEVPKKAVNTLKRKIDREKVS